MVRAAVAGARAHPAPGMDPPLDKVKELEAHSSYVTNLAVYPKHTLLLTASSKDRLIKLCDWSQGWTCTRVIDTHKSVYDLTVGPRDASTFASSSYKRVIKVCLPLHFLI
jgi:WD40 repeat protein